VGYQYSIDEAWRRIHKYRHQRPGFAWDDGRKPVFVSAMKQAEQFFRLSDQVTYDVKPILLYYGLNQAARGILAAVANRDEPWQFSGHGLKLFGVEDMQLLGDIQVSDPRRSRNPPSKPDGFVALARCAGSPTLPKRAAFRELWASLPEGCEALLANSYSTWAAAGLKVKTLRNPTDPSVEVKVVDLTFGVASWSEDPQELTAQIHQKYPQIKYLVPAQINGKVPTPDPEAGYQRRTVRLLWSPKEPLVSLDFAVEQFTHEIYQGWDGCKALVVPTLGDNTAPLSPIVTWYAVLFALSMLARYEPATWTRLLDVDNSIDSTAIEYLLDEAHRACVNMILDRFDDARKTHFWARDPLHEEMYGHGDDE
jgi:hypothetical protein